MSGPRDALAGLLVAVPFLMGAAAAPVSEQRVVFSFADPEIAEASGLAVLPAASGEGGELFATVNDSGDTGRVFVVDPATGETVDTTTFDDAAVDVEALAPAGDDRVWVGDVGDNLERRASVAVTLVAVGRGAGAPSGASAASYELVYPDGAHDAETLLCDPATGRLYVATKQLLGGTLWAAPETLDPDAPNELSEIGPVLPLATDGAFLPDGRHVVLRDYARAVVYAWPSLDPVETLVLPAQEQGEAIAVDPDDDPAGGAAYVTSEGVGADVLAVDLPDLAPVAAASTPDPSSSPTRTPTRSREDRELPEAMASERSAWPWFLGGWIGVGFLVLLLRSMRRPDRR